MGKSAEPRSDDTAAIPKGPPPVIAVSMGDAAGVGPELCVRLLNEPAWPEGSMPLVFGDARTLERVAKAIDLPLKVPRITQMPEPFVGPAIFDVADALAGLDVQPGRNQGPCGKASARFIEAAVRACQAGQCHALVTAPISKKALSLAGIEFPGHTEMIASLTGCERYAMLLYSEAARLAVAHVTSHQPLKSVPESLTVERIVQVAALLNQHLKLLNEGSTPRIAILGLNPHAGEEGLFGDEEELLVRPAVQRVRALGIEAEGPLPPDTAFAPRALERYQGHVALYHDQGGIPFKMRAFDTGINVTMGLEMIRTSPDHGTAYDIAWQGKAKPDSFFSAYALAAKLAVAHLKGTPNRRPSSRRIVLK
ncbi:MAG: 4-hydroxythreonine-4-phosphate dehydrogenase PdxA [Planctomycetota bacterium]|nr:4-hydroxythreonine-4-phosphate dehydrogenase PdxA [Planctomycetota bacterium]